MMKKKRGYHQNIIQRQADKSGGVMFPEQNPSITQDTADDDDLEV